MFYQLACSSGDSSIFVVAMAVTVVLAFFTGGVFARAMYDDFNRRLIIYVEAQKIELLKEVPSGAIPVHVKGKVAFYIMEQKRVK